MLAKGYLGVPVVRASRITMNQAGVSSLEMHE